MKKENWKRKLDIRYEHRKRKLDRDLWNDQWGFSHVIFPKRDPLDDPWHDPWGFSNVFFSKREYEHWEYWMMHFGMDYEYWKRKLDMSYEFWNRILNITDEYGKRKSDMCYEFWKRKLDMIHEYWKMKSDMMEDEYGKRKSDMEDEYGKRKSDMEYEYCKMKSDIRYEHRKRKLDIRYEHRKRKLDRDLWNDLWGFSHVIFPKRDPLDNPWHDPWGFSNVFFSRMEYEYCKMKSDMEYEYCKMKSDMEYEYCKMKSDIICDAGSSDADTNGREIAVKRQKFHKNYNCSCHGTKLIKSALRFAYTVLPCAGGTDPGKSQRGNQDHSQIYHASLKFLSKCPHPSEYVNKTLEKCVNVCGSYIQDGNCTYHCMRDSSKTKLVEFCAKPKILFGFCPEYDPVDQTIQKDTTTLCNSTSTHNHYNSSDIYFCNPDNCLQLLESDVRSSATTLMTGTTEINGGNLQEVWPLQNWTLILLIVVVVIGLAISFACILYKQGHCRTRHRNEKLTNYAETVKQKLLRRQ